MVGRANIATEKVSSRIANGQEEAEGVVVHGEEGEDEVEEACEAGEADEEDTVTNTELAHLDKTGMLQISIL